MHTAPSGYEILRDTHGRPWAVRLKRSPFAPAEALSSDEVAYLGQILVFHQLERDISFEDAVANLGARIRVRPVQDELTEHVKCSAQQLAALSLQQAHGFDAYYVSEHGSPYFDGWRGNICIVCKQDLTPAEQGMVADMTGVQWVPGVVATFTSQEVLLLDEPLLHGLAFQSCVINNRLLLIPATLYLLHDVRERLRLGIGLLKK